MLKARVCQRWTIRARCRAACVLAGLTDDDGAHVLPADAQLVPGLADEGGVDGVVHLLHHQLVVHHHHCVGQKAGRPGGGRCVCQVHRYTNSNI